MKIFTVVKSAAVSVVVTAALIMISAALAYFFGLSDEVTGMIMFAASAVSVLIGSVTAAKGCDGHRIVCCLLSAALYLIIVFCGGCDCSRTDSVRDALCRNCCRIRFCGGHRMSYRRQKIK